MFNQQLFPSHPIGTIGSNTKFPFEYPNLDEWITAKFMSVNLDPTESGVPANRIINANDPTDGAKALQEVAILHTTPYVPTDPRNKLKPINNFWEKIKFKPVIITQIRFYVIGTKSAGSATGQTPIYTPAQVDAVITDSLDSPNYAYNQPGMVNTAISMHQPNFFNPMVKVGGVDVIANTALSAKGSEPCDTLWMSDPDTTSNKGMLSIGSQTPYDFTAIKRVLATSVEVYAQYYQMLNMNSNVEGATEELIRYQRYPILCEIDFLTFKI